MKQIVLLLLLGVVPVQGMTHLRRLCTKIKLTDDQKIAGGAIIATTLIGAIAGTVYVMEQKWSKKS